MYNGVCTILCYVKNLTLVVILMNVSYINYCTYLYLRIIRE